MPTRMRCRAGMDDRLALFVYVKGKARSKLERDRDEVRRRLHVRLSHLPSRVGAGVRRLRLREVRQVTRREGRGDWRHCEHDETQGQRPAKTGAMGGANHDAGGVTRIPPSRPRASFSLDTLVYRRKSVDSGLSPGHRSTGRFCPAPSCYRHFRRNDARAARSSSPSSPSSSSFVVV
jgi:hypothetical protein